MQIKKIKEGTKLTLALVGDLNTMTSPELAEVLSKALDGISELVFDFAALDYLTSAGIRVLMDAMFTMKEKGTMAILHANAEVREIFEVTGLTEILNVQK